MKYIVIIVLVASTLFVYQNCSKVSFGETEEAADILPQASQNPSTETEESVTPEQPATPSTPPVSSKDCYLDYMTAYSWTNSASSPTEVAPTLGAKISTFEIYNSNSTTSSQLKTSLDYGANVAMRVFALRTIDSSTGASSVTLYFDKYDMYDAETELTCSFGPSFDSSVANCGLVSDPTAKMTYQNMGVGLNGVNGFTGWLSCAPKFVACKVTKGSQATKIHSADGKSAALAEDFILKRGCGN